MRAILFGPPGAGKGTQGRRLAEYMDVPAYVMGDILRTAVKEETRLGRLAMQYMEKGQLVPDDVIIDIIEHRVTLDQASHGFLLDGFPRNVAQAEALTHLLAKHGITVNRVVFLDVQETVVIERLSGRLLCRACGFEFHRHYSPPRRLGCCDQCGGELYQRADDREKVISERLAVYRKQTQPMLDYYRDHPAFRKVNGDGDLETVYQQLIQAVTS